MYAHSTRYCGKCAGMAWFRDMKKLSWLMTVLWRSACIRMKLPCCQHNPTHPPALKHCISKCIKTQYSLNYLNSFNAIWYRLSNCHHLTLVQYCDDLVVWRKHCCQRVPPHMEVEIGHCYSLSPTLERICWVHEIGTILKDENFASDSDCLCLFQRAKHRE